MLWLHERDNDGTIKTATVSVYAWTSRCVPRDYGKDSNPIEKNATVRLIH